jgi:peroxiredoxin
MFFRFATLIVLLLTMQGQTAVGSGQIPQELPAERLFALAEKEIVTRRGVTVCDERTLEDTYTHLQFLLDIADRIKGQNPSEEMRTKAELLKVYALKQRTEADRFKEKTGSQVQPKENTGKNRSAVAGQRGFVRNAENDRLRLMDAFLLKQFNTGKQGNTDDVYLALFYQDPIELSPCTLEKPAGFFDDGGQEADAFSAISGLLDVQALSFSFESKSGRSGSSGGLTAAGITLNGNYFDIKKYRGKVVLLDFFAPWCRPCAEELPGTKELYNRYRRKGFEIVSVGAGSPLSLQEFVRQQGISWTVLSNESTVRQQLPSIMNQYNITNLPTAYLLDPHGQLLDDNVRGPRLKEKLAAIFRE